MPWDFTEMKAALFWGLKPWEFRGLSVDNKAELLAGYIVDHEVESYYNSEQARVADKISKKK